MKGKKINFPPFLTVLSHSVCQFAFIPKKYSSGDFCCWGVNTKTYIGRRVNLFGVFGAQRVNGTELFALNTISLSVLLYYFLSRLRPGTLSINSAVKQNTSPPPINRNRPHICSLKAGTILKVQFSYSVNTKYESPVEQITDCDAAASRNISVLWNTQVHNGDRIPVGA